MSHTYRYLHLDVFTDTPFEGNQLAVFPEPGGLSTERMQRIAAEMAFSESTFMFPPEAAGTDLRMRIFTPREELPMAGHPTIGSTFALAELGVIAPGRQSFVFGLGVGPTPVSLEWKQGRLDFAWMTQQLPTVIGSVRDRQALAAALGLSPSDMSGDLPVEAISCGVPFVFAPLVTRAAVDTVTITRGAYAACLAAAGIPELPIFLFTRERGTSAGEEAVYSRMLAPGFGIAEDPATGGASGPLGCYLSAHNLLSQDELQHFVSLQGVAMGRPSRIHISIEHRNSGISRVRVGGRSVLVGEGTLRVPTA
jgi:trans-2,3-dihydro-3-hydroxyanthranilate isomerase